MLNVMFMDFIVWNIDFVNLFCIISIEYVIFVVFEKVKVVIFKIFLWVKIINLKLIVFKSFYFLNYYIEMYKFWKLSIVFILLLKFLIVEIFIVIEF